MLKSQNPVYVNTHFNHPLEITRESSIACARLADAGIPLGNLKREETVALVDKIGEALAPGGMYIQFQYSLIARRKIHAKFPRLRTAPAFLNFPPAFVYYARK